RDPELEWEDQSCVGVVVASKGYPGEYHKGVKLPSVHPENDAFVVHAGTKQTTEGLVSNGGRVLLAGAVGTDLPEAAQKTYQYLQEFDQTDAFFYRRDISRY